MFVDYASGLSNPNLSLLNLTTRRSIRLISEQHRQEHPRLDGATLVWQDDRSGVWQVYVSNLTLPPTVATYPVAPGFNLVAVTAAMQTQFGMPSRSWPTGSAVPGQADRRLRLREQGLAAG